MANEPEKTIVSQDASAEADVPEEAVTKRGITRPIVMFGGLVAVAVVLGIVLALFVIRPITSGSDNGGGSDELARVTPAGRDAGAEAEHARPRRKESRGIGSSTVYTIKDIVINPAATGGTRFLSVSFAFDLESPGLEAVFRDREPAIRDALITILASKTVPQLTDPKQKEIIRYQIKKRISDLLQTDALAGVYYTDFVLQ